MKRAHDPEWFAFLRVGDVLEVNGALRVVRQVSRWANRHDPIERLRYVTFAIRHISWTGRCYTVYTAADLRRMRIRYVGARVKLASEMDGKIAAAITQRSSERPYVLTAHDVRGVA